MSQSTVNQLIAGIGGAHVATFFIVLARVTPLFVIAPMFSSKDDPQADTGRRRSRACRGAHAGRLAWCPRPHGRSCDRRTDRAIDARRVRVRVRRGDGLRSAQSGRRDHRRHRRIQFRQPGGPDERHPIGRAHPLLQHRWAHDLHHDRRRCLDAPRARADIRDRPAHEGPADRLARRRRHRLRSVRSSSAQSNSPRRRCSR